MLSSLAWLRPGRQKMKFQSQLKLDTASQGPDSKLSSQPFGETGILQANGASLQLDKKGENILYGENIY